MKRLTVRVTELLKVIGIGIVVLLLLAWWVAYSIGAVGFWWEQ